MASVLLFFEILTHDITTQAGSNGAIGVFILGRGFLFSACLLACLLFLLEFEGVLFWMEYGTNLIGIGLAFITSHRLGTGAWGKGRFRIHNRTNHTKDASVTWRSTVLLAFYHFFLLSWRISDAGWLAMDGWAGLVSGRGLFELTIFIFSLPLELLVPSIQISVVMV